MKNYWKHFEYSKPIQLSIIWLFPHLFQLRLALQRMQIPPHRSRSYVNNWKKFKNEKKIEKKKQKLTGPLVAWNRQFHEWQWTFNDCIGLIHLYSLAIHWFDSVCNCNSSQCIIENVSKLWACINRRWSIIQLIGSCPLV